MCASEPIRYHLPLSSTSLPIHFIIRHSYGINLSSSSHTPLLPHCSAALAYPVTAVKSSQKREIECDPWNGMATKSLRSLGILQRQWVPTIYIFAPFTCEFR